MANTSWMIERLAGETRSHHTHADADFDLLFREDASSADYMVFLMRVYGFEAPLESALSMTPTFDRIVDLRGRQKAGWIAQDMLALGLRPNEVAEVPQCLTIPQFRGAAEALGWMYVVERTTLAHSVIRRHLQTKLPREINRASAYLQSYNDVVGVRWRQFGLVLDEVARHPALADQIVTAANDAFHCREQWVQHDDVATRSEAV